MQQGMGELAERLIQRIRARLVTVDMREWNEVDVANFLELEGDQGVTPPLCLPVSLINARGFSRFLLYFLARTSGAVFSQINV